MYEYEQCDRRALNKSAYARIRAPLLQQRINISCAPGPQLQTRSSGFAGPMLGQTNGRTPLHTVLAAWRSG